MTDTTAGSETRSLDGKFALVTGGGTGIGAAVGVALAAQGARVAVSFRTHPPDDATREAMRFGSCRPPIVFALDATSEDDVAVRIDELTRQEGPVDILVNNVGGLVRRSSIVDMDWRLWREVIAVNLDSTFLITHHVMRRFNFAGGRIINIASLAARNGGHPGATAYAAAKAGVLGFTRGLARELGDRGTTVNAIAPGFIENTPFHDTFTSPESKTQTISTVPAGRAGRPADVATAAVWLSQHGSSYISGAVIDVNGGQYFG